MYKQSPSRNQRSKGIKVKHVLQICLLLAVCFWLIYQVKHSHDKKKEFHKHDAKSSIDSLSKDEVVKLGRKDLQPLKEGTFVESDEHSEEVEDEEIEEEATVEEENKHEGEGKENKTEAKDENGEGRGSVDEEVNDPDQEKSELENDREEDFEDEDKERENDDEQELKDKDSEDNGQTYTDSASQKHDNGGVTMRRHEARDENYKADDASSAVTLDTQMTSNGNETVVLGKSNEQGKVNSLEPHNNFYHNDLVDVSQSVSVNVEGSETTTEGHLGTTTNEQSENSISNSSVAEMSITHSNSTEESGEVQAFSLLNGNGTVSEHNEDQIVIEEHKKSSDISTLEISDPNLEDNSTLPVNSDLSDLNLTVSSESKSRDPTLEESHAHGVTESSNSEMKHNVTSKADSSVTENPEDDGTIQKNGTLDKSTSENSYNTRRDSEDSFNSKLSREEKDVHTAL